ncbi:Protein of unknown function [Gryllus bimaculatus]|nr:Protein of unknown function [Gryllus bimaculatus]
MIDAFAHGSSRPSSQGIVPFPALRPPRRAAPRQEAVRVDRRVDPGPPGKSASSNSVRPGVALAAFPRLPCGVALLRPQTPTQRRDCAQHFLPRGRHPELSAGAGHALRPDVRVRLGVPALAPVAAAAEVGAGLIVRAPLGNRERVAAPVAQPSDTIWGRSRNELMGC